MSPPFWEKSFQAVTQPGGRVSRPWTLSQMSPWRENRDAPVLGDVPLKGCRKLEHHACGKEPRDTGHVSTWTQGSEDADPSPAQSPLVQWSDQSTGQSWYVPG